MTYSREWEKISLTHLVTQPNNIHTYNSCIFIVVTNKTFTKKNTNLKTI